MANKEDLSRSRPARSWTGIDIYLRPLRRRSAARRRLSARLPGDPDRPRDLLGALPFVALTLGLALITLIIFSLAWPGQYRERMRPDPQAEARPAEPGTAPPGWIDG